MPAASGGQVTCLDHEITINHESALECLLGLCTHVKLAVTPHHRGHSLQPHGRRTSLENCKT
jgi:hypothetical protein